MKRAGVVLIAVGVADIAAMLYCIANEISYSSSINVFAVVGGVLLLRGNLVAVAVVRWFAAFLLAGLLAFVVILPFAQPLDLTLVQARSHPPATLAAIALGLFAVGLLVWLLMQLGSAPVASARRAAGLPKRSLLYPAAVGVAVITGLAVAVPFLLNGEYGARAKMAAAQLGPGFRYRVKELFVERNGQRTLVRSVVNAWNSEEVFEVPVEWEER